MSTANQFPLCQTIVPLRQRSPFLVIDVYLINGLYANANRGAKLSRMNDDIYIGNIVGLPGRVAMFLAVLIGASLPITGFYIWWGKRRKNKKAAKEKANKILSASFNQKKHTTRNRSVKGVYIF